MTRHPLPALTGLVGVAALAVLALTARAEHPPGPAPAAPDPAPESTPEPSAPLVVIDPGHGGGNTGAPGTTEAISEKHVTLAISLALAERLRERGYRVRLTRTDDRYLPLRRRVGFGNRVGADIFLSIHANASPTHAMRGYESYILSPRGIDHDARALRLEDGRERPGVGTEVAAILDDVERGLAQEPAAALALAVQDQLREVWGPADERGVKQDSMHVLLGATMPAVLVEVGFVDHAVEGRQLMDHDIQARLADALAEAVSLASPIRVAISAESH